jgi:hypothetical protein
MRPAKSSLLRKVTLYERGACPPHANLRTASMSPGPWAVYLASLPRKIARCRPQMATLLNAPNAHDEILFNG